MDAFSSQLNDLLVETYRSVVKVEEQTLKSVESINLSLSEMHLLEAVGKGGENGLTISDIAQNLWITLPSVTIAINKLAKKGYVEKAKCLKDGRVVYVALTKLGHKMVAAHRYFHEQMIRNISEGFTEQEKSILLEGIGKLNKFFKNRIADLEA